MVDDDSINRKILAKPLLQHHYEVIEAVNGLDALSKVSEENPDMLLLDLMMPEMDGYSVLQHLRKTKSQVELPIILITAMHDSQDIVKGFHLGANDYLQKNFNKEELLARIESALQIKSFHSQLKERNNIIEKELDIARLIQINILPKKSPFLPGFVVSSLYVPMDKVGGDFFDYEEEEEYCDFLIADVSGHGVPGALLATVLKMSFQYAHTLKLSPTDTLKLMDQSVSERGALGMFATAMILRIFPKTGLVEYSNAGHHPLLLHRRTENIFLEFSTPGIPLGLNYELKRKPFLKSEFTLVPGDRLILCTDGILETTDGQGSDYDSLRWKDFLSENIECKTEVLPNLLLKDLYTFTPSANFNDDLALLVIDFDKKEL
ncbi:integral membrane sensor hybrid histidine kinase [Leptospira ryugenii]|uniref:Integral membrane sensor hybrid histidine kinase n=1 Tax=Leptospira ryugenii TaxID=1917863 RepID=A0A2P2E4T2_9LEPT|nr:integral membrane sensor hybrid histidine kinase [Leptospira ryugenii]